MMPQNLVNLVKIILTPVIIDLNASISASVRITQR